MNVFYFVCFYFSIIFLLVSFFALFCCYKLNSLFSFTFVWKQFYLSFTDLVHALCSTNQQSISNDASMQCFMHAIIKYNTVNIIWYLSLFILTVILAIWQANDVDRGLLNEACNKSLMDKMYSLGITIFTKLCEKKWEKIYLVKTSKKMSSY